MLKEQPREVLDVEGAAELLGISEHAVRRFAREQRIPGRKLGKEWRFSRRRLLELIEGEESTTEERR